MSAGNFRQPVAAAFVAACALAALAGQARAQRYIASENSQHPRVKFTDSLVSLNDYCPVRHTALSTQVKPIYVNGQPVAFCCGGCRSRLVDEPEKHLKPFSLKLPDPVHPERMAVVDSLHRIRLNSELFYFADEKSMKEFRKHPERYAGLLTEPISRRRFFPVDKNPREDFEGTTFIFATDSTRAMFRHFPQAYSHVR